MKRADRKGYPSDVSDEEWSLAAPYLTLMDITAPQRKYELRDMFDALHNDHSLARAKRGALLINTSRGGLVDTEAVIQALKSGQLGGVALDVYEQEADLFFRDLFGTIITDDTLQRLISFPNVIVTGHQAFFTREAVTTICQTTLRSVTEFETGKPLSNEIMTS